MKVEREKTPEQIMWQSVVFRAFLDATGEERNPRDEANSWIRRGGRDFKRVVSMAGMDPDFLREAYVSGRMNPNLLRHALRG
jgi:hypothetical protein